ncbi:MAG: hypothetical protein NTZ74_10175 [Chloroflexi bacterium]|nr:hypothetical protein [Chloroflexota bacterium]
MKTRKATLLRVLLRRLFWPLPTHAWVARPNAAHGICTGGRDPRTPSPTPAPPGPLAAA